MRLFSSALASVLKIIAARGKDMTPLMHAEFQPFSWPSLPIPGLVRKRTIADGSCFFHALCDSFFEPYVNQLFDGRATSRRDIVRSLRRDLSARLSEPIDPLDPASPSHYDSLHLAREFPECSLKNMQRELAGSGPVSNLYNEYISNVLEKDIYILDFDKQDVYATGDDTAVLYKRRPSIVLMYSPGHYELVGRMTTNGELETLFHPDSQLIQAIGLRLRSKQKTDIPDKPGKRAKSPTKKSVPSPRRIRSPARRSRA